MLPPVAALFVGLAVLFSPWEHRGRDSPGYAEKVPRADAKTGTRADLVIRLAPVPGGKSK